MKKYLLFFLVLATVQLAKSQVLTGMTAYYPFNGNSQDVSGQGHHLAGGRIFGDFPTLTTDRFGNANQAMSFSGSNWLVSTPPVITATNNFSVSCWVRPSNLTQNANFWYNGEFGYMFVRNTGYGLGMSGNGSLMGAIGAGPSNPLPTSSLFTSTSTWYHVVMMVDDGVTKFYVNGTQLPETYSAMPPFTPTLAFTVGAASAMEGNWFTGDVDDIYVFERVLTNTEISALYTEGGATNGCTPTISSNSPLCEGTTLQLSCTSASSYSWSGPDSFVSTEQNPAVSNATMAKAGVYSVSVTTGECTATASAVVTINNCPSTPAKALQFDGLNDKVELGNWFNYQTFSLEMWVKPSSVPTGYVDIIDNDHRSSQNWVLQYDPNTSQYYFGIGQASGQILVIPFSLTVGTWQHIALVKDATETRFYLNGVLQGAPYPSGDIFYNGAQSLRLGGWGAGGRHWHGALDEVRIWDRALQAQEVSANLNCQLEGSSAGLVAHYRANQGVVNGDNTAQSTLTDATGNHPGTFSGFELTGTASNFAEGQELSNCAVHIAASKTSVCAGQSVNLFATSCAGTVVWSDGVNGLSRSNVVFSNTTTLTATCQVGQVVSAPSNAVTITVTLAPNLNVQSNSPVCEGQTLTMSVTGGDTYSWACPNGNCPEGFNSTAANPSFVGATGSTGIYTVTGSAWAGCSATQTVSVQVNALPTIAVTPAAQCGGTLNLSTAFSSNGALSYFSDSGFSSTVANPVSNSGTYYAKASLNGCTATASVGVTINPLPTIAVTTPTPVCSPNTVNLQAAVSSNGTLSFFSDSGFSMAVANPTAVAVGGTYYIKATSTAGCTATASVSVTIGEHPDLQPLIDLYNATNGANWTNKQGWLSGCNPCSWYGITCTDGRVTKVGLSQNNLSGSIPSSLGNLTNLKELYLDNNQLSSLIPTELGNLSSLQHLTLYSNQLNGPIPSSLGNLNNLQYLHLYNNHLNGSIPNSLGQLSNLQSLALNNNQLSGSISNSLGQLSNLQFLALNNNQLNGSIPSSLGQLSNLQFLLLNNNQLNGSIPNSLGGLSNLITFNLANNQLSGSIPNSIGNLSSLQSLYSNNNQLSGSIPSSLGGLSNLSTLDLQNNQLSGCYPISLSTLCNRLGSVAFFPPFLGNTGLPGGGSSASWQAFCATGAGSDNFTPVATTTTPSVCVGGGIQLSASGGTAYSWSGPNGYTSSNRTPNLTASSTALGGVYTVVVSNGGGACTATATVGVAINPLPTIAIATPSAQCGTLNLSTAFSSNGALTYFSDSGFSSTVANPVSSSGTYYAKASLNGCTATASVGVTINPLPTIAVTTPAAQCEGTLNLNTAFSSNGALTYFSDSGFSSTVATPVSSSGTYYAKATLNGCTATASVGVTINPLPTIAVTTPAAQCGGTINLSTAFSSNGSLEYFSDSGFSSTVANPVSSSGTYYAKATLNSCTATASVGVTINPLPTIAVTTPAAQCGGTLNLSTAFSSNGTLSYFSDSGFSSAAATPVSSSGTYYAKASLNGCTAKASVGVTINPLPTIAVTTPAAQCGGTINLSTAFSSNGVLTYFSDSGFSSTVANPVSSSGTYYAKASLNGCTATASAVVTINNCPSTPASALQFDGLDDKVELGNWFNYQTFSLEMWVKPSSVPTGYVDIIDTDHRTNQNWVLQYDPNTSQYYFGIGQASGQILVIPFSLTVGTWQHIALVKDATETRFYLNGVLQGSPYPSGDINYNGAQSLRLGGWGAGGRHWQGALDEIRIWDRALQAQEVSANLNCQLEGSSAGLVAHYRANQGVVNGDNTAQSTLIDATGNHPGTFSGFELTGTASNFAEGQELSNCALHIAASKASVCAGQSVNLFATSCAGTVVWSDGVNGLSRSNVVFSNTTTLTATCQVGQVVSAPSNAVTITVTPISLSIQLSGSHCVGETISLAVTGGDTYSWNCPNGNCPEGFNSTSATPTLTAAVARAGIYSVTATNTAGCTGTQTIAVAVNVLPTIAVTTPAPVCPPNTVNLQATVSSNGTLSFFTDSEFSTAVANPRAVAVGGTYYIKASNTNSCSATASVNVIIGEHPDRQPLIDLYNATNGANWTNKQGWLSGCNPCGWYGITCTNGRVTKVDLGANNLRGTLPSSLGNLSNLQNLVLTSNQLSGPILSSLGNLSNLQYLALNFNQLSSSIPSSLGSLSDLQYLALSNNELSGTIPSSLENLGNLQNLLLHVNQLSGPIPSSLGNLRNLKYLTLDYNQLSGPIPSSLGNLGNLKYLNLSNNELSGPIPSSLGNLSNLQTLYLQSNQLSGSIPSSLGNLGNLQYLLLHVNQLRGAIPTSLGNLSNLLHLHLSENQLSGSIPSSLGNLTRLLELKLNENQLSGCYPSSLSSLCSRLTFYNFNSNTGLPGGGSNASWQAFCATGAGSDNFTPVATTATPSVCVGGVIQLSASGGVAYTWSGPNGYTSSNRTPNLTASSTALGGVYTVVVSNGGSACTAAATVQVAVVSPPTIVISSNSPVCVGQRVNLTASGGSSYGWLCPTGNCPNGFVSNSGKPSFVATSVQQAGFYTVSASNAQGCTASTRLAVDINPLPTTTAGTTTPTVCLGETIRLQASGGVSYTWSCPSGACGFDATTKNPVFASTNLNQAGTYTVVVSNTNGCTASATVSVSINALPGVSVSSNSPVCQGNTLNLSATGGATYNWRGPAAFTSTSNQPARSNVTTNMAGVYSVTVTNAAGCSATQTIAVVINPSPTVTVQSNSPTCVGAIINLSASGGTSYVWSCPTGNCPNGFASTSATPSFVGEIASSGSYSVTIVDGNGCSNSASISVKVNPLPTLNIAIPTAQCGGTLNLNTVFSSNGTLSYFANSGFSSTVANPVSVSGTYYARATLNGCQATASSEVVINPIPTLAVSTPPAQCGGTIDLNTVFSSNGLLAFSNNGGFTSTVANPVSSSGRYFAKATLNGCTATNSVSLTITISPTIVVSTPEVVCPPNTVNLQTVVRSNGTITFFTDSGFSSTVTNPTVVSVGGTYYIKAVSVGNCSTTATVTVRIGAHPDLQPLIDLYNATNGANWRSKTGWLSGCDPCTWLGVGCSNGRVNSLTLRYNRLQGELPASLSGLSNLETINLEGNQLTGMIPSSLGNLSNLQVLALNNNAFSGPIPSSLGNLLNLKQLLLFDNNLSGSIPAVLGNLRNVEIIALDMNNLTGAIPGSLGNLSNLKEFSVASNQLNGQLPTELGNLTRITHFMVHRNQLSGPIPDYISNLPELKSLDLSYNQFVGSIPAGLGLLNNLTALFVNNNQLTGCYPSALSGLCARLSSPSYDFSNNAGLPGGGSRASWQAFCATGAGSSNFVASTSTPVVCTGNTVELSASGGLSYSWQGYGFTSTAQKPSFRAVSVTQGGIYTVSAQNGSGCTGTATVSVEVLPAPKLTVVDNVAACLGQTVTLSASGGDSYTWDCPSGTCPNGFNRYVSNPSYIATSTMQGGSFTVTAENRFGCLAIGSYKVGVTIYPLPTATASTTTSIVCLGETIRLQASGGVSYTWSCPSGTCGFESTTRNPVFASTNLNQAGTYTVVVSNANGCTSSATVSVSINALPNARADNNSPVCQGETLLFGAIGGTTYNWRGPAAFTSTSNLPNRSNVTTNMAGLYSVTVTNAAGCSAVATTSVAVNPITTANISISTGKPYVCAGNTITLSVSPIAGATYRWYRETVVTGLNPIQDAITNQVAVTLGGTYHVDITNSSGCTYRASITIISLSALSLAASYSFSQNGTVLNLAATPTGLIYSWSGPGGFSSTLRNPSRSPVTTAMAGAYQVAGVQASSGCTATATTSVVIGTTSSRLAATEQAEVAIHSMELYTFPNPTQGKIQVEVRLQKPESIHLYWLNTLGQTKQQWYLPEKTTVHRIELDVSESPEGFYLLYAETEEAKRASKKVWKQH
ncbi:MAG: LamG-like jellyroll fold domain-containing protein [Spirosomataceae bacterium]